MNAIDHTHTTLLNVVVFSNFPENIFENEIRSKLLENRVNVIRVYKPDRTDAAITDVSQADAVLVFIDFMSHPQDELIRKKARAWGKSIIALRRQTSSEWPKLLETVMPKPKSFGQFLREERESFRITIKDVAEKTRASVADVKAWESDETLPTGSQMSRLRIIFNKIAYHPSFRAVPVAENDEAPESMPPSVKQAMHTFMGLTLTKVGEDEILHVMRELHSPDLTNLEQVEDLFERYVKTDCAPAEFRAWWDDYKKSKLLPLPPPSLRVVPPAPASEPDPVPEPSEVELLERQLHDAKTMEAMYEEELRKAREEAAAFKDQLQKTLDQCSGAQGALAAAEHRHTSELARIKTEARDAIEAAEKRHKVDLESLRDEMTHRNMENTKRAADDALDRLRETEAERDVAVRRKNELEGTIADLRRRLAEAKNDHPVTSEGKLDKIAAHIKSLYEHGAFTREEVGNKLASLVIGAS